MIGMLETAASFLILVFLVFVFIVAIVKMVQHVVGYLRGWR